MNHTNSTDALPDSQTKPDGRQLSLMRRVTIQSVVTISRTADDWELYSHRSGAEQAAQDINAAIEKAFNSGRPRYETERLAMAAMRTHVDLGALDSEPLAHLDELMAILYKRGR